MTLAGSTINTPGRACIICKSRPIESAIAKMKLYFLLIAVTCNVGTFANHSLCPCNKFIQPPTELVTKLELYRIAVGGFDDLILRYGDDPCHELRSYCANQLSKHWCFSKLYSELLREILHFSSDLQFLNTDARLFMRCASTRALAIDNTTLVSPMMDKYSSDHIKLQEELLQLLCVNHEGDDLESKMKLFDMRRNEVRMMPQEKLNLFQRAILIQPNSTYVISQLGLALSAVGEDDLAKVLFENAVERGLWPNVLQRPEFTFVPGLSSKPWHDIQDFPFMIKLMEHYGVIRDELLHNLAERSYIFNNEQENANVFTGGDWKALQLKTSPGFNYGYTKYAEYFPRTVKILKECNEDFLLVKFSAIKPGTHIEPHTGPSNERLRSHLTLIHTGGARIRVGSEWRTWKEGEGMILDSSWEHEVMHEGRDIRVVLILDIWHPDYQPSLRK